MELLLNNVKIGTDFETHIIDNSTNKAISSVGICGGSKSEPLSIGEGCFRHEDNVAFEFGMPPCTKYEDFKKYIDYCLNTGNSIIGDINPDYSLSLASSNHFDAKELMSDQAMLFGCDPALDAYTEGLSEYPERDPKHSLRSFGFHIHLGWDGIENSAEVIFNLTKLMDFHLGIPSLLLDTDTERRTLYGKAGEVRWKDYGFEYRSLGTGMMKYTKFVWNQTNAVIDLFNSKSEKIAEIIAFMNANHNIINDNNIERALEVCKEFALIPKEIEVLV